MFFKELGFLWNDPGVFAVNLVFEIEKNTPGRAIGFVSLLSDGLLGCL